MTTHLRSRPAIGLALALALLAAACGSRLTEDERAQLMTSGGGARTPGAAGVGGPATGLGDDGFEVGDDGAALDPGARVDAGAPEGGGADPGAAGGEGGGDPGAGGEGGAAPAACRPEEGGGPGVSMEEIRFGNVSTLSGPIPNFGRTGVNGVRAYFNMVNAEGGVCGRRLTLVGADDRLQAAANRAEHEKLSNQVLGFVGSTTVTDDGGTPIIDGNGIPDVSLAISDARIRSQHNFSPNPIDLSPGAGNGAGKMFAWMRETYGVGRAAIIWPAQASARGRALEYETDFTNAGIETIHKFEVAITETNFTSQVNTMANSNIDIVVTALEVNGMARLAQEFGQRRYFPEVPFYGAQAYGRTFLQLAGASAEGTRIGIAYAIPEDAPNNPAIARFNDWYARTNPGADVDFFAIMGWIAADMLVTGLRDAGPAPTRESLQAALQQHLADYDGGGIVGSIDAVNKKSARCYAVIEVRDGGWRRVHPAQGFQC
jgi:ABC-type branched-subunit amino acid transport system substrate-binding protein